jgi:FkbM family methyltransferase
MLRTRMSTLNRLRLLARTYLRVDVSRYPRSDPLFLVGRLLQSYGVTLVLDVGANDGGYASAIRHLGYDNRIVSFEPTNDAYQRLREVAMTDPRWSTVKLAIGERDARVPIHVAGNAGASSSLLPMLDRHVQASPSSAYTHTELVEMRQLDNVLSDYYSGSDVAFLKLDVQGAEGAVLDGAQKSLESLEGLQIEMNLVSLYDGQAHYRALIDRIVGHGFELVGLIPGFADSESGHLLAADGVFMKRQAEAAAPDS